MKFWGWRFTLFFVTFSSHVRFIQSLGREKKSWNSEDGDSFYFLCLFQLIWDSFNHSEEKKIYLIIIASTNSTALIVERPNSLDFPCGPIFFVIVAKNFHIKLPFCYKWTRNSKKFQMAYLPAFISQKIKINYFIPLLETHKTSIYHLFMSVRRVCKTIKEAKLIVFLICQPTERWLYKILATGWL